MNNTLLYVITVLIWGSTWIAINYQLGDVAPEASLVYRFGLAAMILMAYCHYKKLPLSFNGKQHLSFIAFGATLFGCNYYFLYLGQQHINSALTSIAFSTLMLVNIINTRIWFKTTISPQVYYGGALGLIGILTLFWPQINDIDYGKETLIGLSLCLIGTLFASTGNMISIGNQKKQLPIIQSNAWGMTYGSILMAIMTVLQGETFTFSWTFSYVSSLIYLSLFGSVIAFGCYLSLLSKIGAHKASYSSIMFPAIAVIISTFIEGFVWNIYTVIGCSCMVLGNLVVLSRPSKAAKTNNLLAENDVAKAI
ncbi:DMT family transporter [Colwelliaceae bacterium 6471]